MEPVQFHLIFHFIAQQNYTSWDSHLPESSLSILSTRFEDSDYLLSTAAPTRVSSWSCYNSRMATSSVSPSPGPT